MLAGARNNTRIELYTSDTGRVFIFLSFFFLFFFFFFFKYFSFLLFSKSTVRVNLMPGCGRKSSTTAGHDTELPRSLFKWTKSAHLWPS